MILTTIAAVHNVQSFQDACPTTDLTTTHALATQLRCALKTYAGMARHVILIMTAIVHNAQMLSSVQQTTSTTLSNVSVTQ